MAGQTENKPANTPAPTPQARRSAVALLALLLALGAVGLAGWQWFDWRRSFSQFERDAAKRFSEMEVQSRESRTIAAQSRDATTDISARLGQLEARLAETQNQRLALE